jgi:transcription elongation GreA/GreB family factor
LREKNSNKEETYTILGAWDGNPERHVISYQTAIGQALLGKKPGDSVTLDREEGPATFEVTSISAAPVDQVAPEHAPEEAAPAAL